MSKREQAVTREERCRAEALALFPQAWGCEYDENDSSDRAALEQLVQELLAKSPSEASNV